MADFHAFETGGGNYLFFARSARLYELSQAAARMLSELMDRGGPLESCDAAHALLPDGPADEAGPKAELRHLFQDEMQVPQPVSYSRGGAPGHGCFQTFSIYLAQSCNMSCGYCWNLGGTFGKKPHLMGSKGARLATDLIVSLIGSSRAEKIYLNFYGGEPLLNFPVLRRIVLELRRQEARLAKEIYFTLDTNGLLLEGKVARFLAQHFAQIGVSLDGRQEIHDLQRPGPLGESTWQRIVDNVGSFPKLELLSLRATLTAISDSYLETFHALTGAGVRRIQLEYCHEPGHRANPNYESLLVPPKRQLAELREFIDEYVLTISRYKKTSEIPFISSLLDNVTRLRHGNRFTRPCGAGMNTVAIDSHGKVFPCIAFVDRDDFAMGRVGTRSDLSLHQSLAGFEVDDQLPCHACWLRYDCAGGCYATHHDMTGNARQPHPEYCRNMRSKAELHFYAMGQMLKECPWHLEKTG